MSKSAQPTLYEELEKIQFFLNDFVPDLVNRYIIGDILPPKKERRNIRPKNGTVGDIGGFSTGVP